VGNNLCGLVLLSATNNGLRKKYKKKAGRDAGNKWSGTPMRVKHTKVLKLREMS